MTSEEQLSFIAARDQKLHKLTDMIGRLLDDCSSFKNKDSIDDDVRTEDEVSEAIEELFDKVWYNRHQVLRYRVLNKREEIHPEIGEDALASAK